MEQISCKSLVDVYTNWIKEKFSVVKIGDVCEITTPFVDRHNDKLQIYVKKTNNGFLLTDDSYIISDLQLSGLEFSTPKRKEILQVILNSFGVCNVNDELQIEATDVDFAQKKHNLLQAMISINDMHVMSRPNVVGFFKEDVQRFLHAHQIFPIPGIQLSGRSGFSHSFDFAFQPTETKPERFIQAIGNPDKQNISSLLFSWEDVSLVRAHKSVAYAILNDESRVIPTDNLIAMKNYNIIPILWSKRDSIVPEFSNSN